MANRGERTKEYFLNNLSDTTSNGFGYGQVIKKKVMYLYISLANSKPVSVHGPMNE